MPSPSASGSVLSPYSLFAIRYSLFAIPYSLPSPDDDRALGGGLLLQRVAKRTARVVHEDVVERGALHRQRFDGDVGRRGTLHHRERGGRPMARRNPRDVVVARYVLDVPQRAQLVQPSGRGVREADLESVLPGDRRLELQRRIERLELAVI